MQEKVQNWTATTFPRRPSGVSGAEFSHVVAPSSGGKHALDRELRRPGHRSDRKVVRISSAKVCGCSQAAK